MYACNNQAKIDVSQTRSHRKYTTVHKFTIFYLYTNPDVDNPAHKP